MNNLSQKIFEFADKMEKLIDERQTQYNNSNSYSRESHAYYIGIIEGYKRFFQLFKENFDLEVK